MLDDRKTAILSAVVQEYIATAQPVGSSHIASAPGVQVSPATVRNDMAVLEQEGFLVQPHTSAGRVPTDKGYRFFVDHLTEPGRLDDSRSAEVGDFFSAAHGRLEELLHQTSDLLTRLTNSASMVLGPAAAATVVRSVQIVGLSTTTATAILVLSNGTVTSEVLDLLEATDDDEIRRAAAHLDSMLSGRSIADSESVPTVGDARVDEIAAAALAALRR
ncbi:MAG: heat-inducible transcriptional repressor HrcA, partial [Ilumatobacteraceae bacterium]|nr:heat-inducible transcriptional repressor HrcA [Ilumatobacteraceae bacterium]